MAFYLVLEGVLELVLSFQLRPLPGSGWLLFDGIVTLALAAMPAWLTSHTIARRSHSVAQVVCYLHQSIMPPVIILPLKTRTSNKTTMTVPMMISTVLVLVVVLLM